MESCSREQCGIQRAACDTNGHNAGIQESFILENLVLRQVLCKRIGVQICPGRPKRSACAPDGFPFSSSSIVRYPCSGARIPELLYHPPDLRVGAGLSRLIPEFKVGRAEIPDQLRRLSETQPTASAAFLKSL